MEMLTSLERRLRVLRIDDRLKVMVEKKKRVRNRKF